MLNDHSISRRGRGFDTGRRCLLTLALAYTGAASAVGISANINAELQSGGQVAVSNSANGVLLDPGDTLTASLSTNFLNSNFNIATTMITGNGTLAMGATVSGASAPPPNGGSLLGGLGGGHLDFEDEITVTSGERCGTAHLSRCCSRSRLPARQRWRIAMLSINSSTTPGSITNSVGGCWT